MLEHVSLRSYYPYFIHRHVVREKALKSASKYVVRCCEKFPLMESAQLSHLDIAGPLVAASFLEAKLMSLWEGG